MKPTEVPAEYVQMMADAEFDAPAGCSAEYSYRTVLAAVLPVHERQVRERVAAEITETIDADVPGQYEAGLERAARIARGES